MPPSELQFIVGTSPSQLKAHSIHTVKSQASRAGWRTHKSKISSLRAQPGAKSRARRPKERCHTVVYECFELWPENSVSPVQEIGPELNDGQSRSGDESWTDLPLTTIEFALGGGRVDPFRSYPVMWNKLIPVFVDHYIVHMAVDIPELDRPGNHGLLRTRWFPLVIASPATFLVVMLLSASNMATVTEHAPRCNLLAMKHDAIRSINDDLSKTVSRSSEEGDGYVSDAMIGAVGKMATFEALHGNVDTFRVHMEGLRRMVAMRGGLDNLGLGGLLRRIVIWIDVNSAFLLKTERYFPGTSFDDGDDLVVEANPGQFIAA